MAHITIDDVTKTFPGGVKGIDELSLDIRDGEFMVLVGPSRTGLARASPPDRVLLLGR